jgi:hypothetical protein
MTARTDFKVLGESAVGPKRQFAAVQDMAAVGALVTDKSLADIDVHPGDEAFVLGFPLLFQVRADFPFCASATSCRIR